MDEMPLYEFSAIFDRVSSTINLIGKLTVEEIEEELSQASKRCEQKYHDADTQRDRNYYKNAKVNFDRLLEHGFARKSIKEATLQPNGMIAMTLKYGKTEAKRRILAQKRSEIRFYRVPSRYGKRVNEDDNNAEA